MMPRGVIQRGISRLCLMSPSTLSCRAAAAAATESRNTSRRRRQVSSPLSVTTQRRRPRDARRDATRARSRYRVACGAAFAAGPETGGYLLLSRPRRRRGATRSSATPVGPTARATRPSRPPPCLDHLPPPRFAHALPGLPAALGVRAPHFSTTLLRDPLEVIW